MARIYYNLFKNGYQYMDAEKNSWSDEARILTFDRITRQYNLRVKDELVIGETWSLCSVDSSWGGIKFQHYFITNGQIELGFGEQNQDIYQAQVGFNVIVHAANHEVAQTRMTDEIRQRIEHVLGMCNYSLCLRNSEHVANYVFRGRWLSEQMLERGSLKRLFPDKVLEPIKKLVNAFPSTLTAHVFGSSRQPIYTENFVQNNNLSRPFTAWGFQYYLDEGPEDTYNILVIGPTGAGKSHLINIFINQNICPVETANLRSTTKDICFIRCTGKSWNDKNRSYDDRPIIIADTVGVCDTEWDEKQVFKLITSRVSANLRHIDAVFIVFNTRARMEKTHMLNIRKIMNWLHYDLGNNWESFFFVGTHGEGLDDIAKDLIVSQAVENLKINNKNRRIVQTEEVMKQVFITSFSPESSLHTPKQREEVVESWNQIRKRLEHPRNPGRLNNMAGKQCHIL